MQFEFASAGRIVFGLGVFSQVGKLAADFGRRALVVFGVQNRALENLVSYLDANGIVAATYPVEGEPDIALLQNTIVVARDFDCDMVISLGGGSALDTGKAVAVMLTNPGDLYDYLEVVGKGKGLKYPGLPFIAIPTTAGTGSEVTRNAVLGAEVPGMPGENVKVSLRSVFMLPRLALVDPELTFSLPANITAATGMDALTQLIEPFLSNKANPLTDGICRAGIVHAARSLLVAVRQGDNSDARTDMSIASLFGGLALANSKLGAVHGFAAPIGGLFHAPHGAVCARLLPIVMQENYQALVKRDPENPVLEKFVEVGRLLTGTQAGTAQDAIHWLTELSSALQIPALASYGITTADLERLAGLAAQASSMQGNPIRLSNAELIDVLSLAL